jgi:hypothetical protein
MADYESFIETVAEDVVVFKRNQAEGMAREEQRYLCPSFHTKIPVLIYSQGTKISSRMGSREK